MSMFIAVSVVSTAAQAAAMEAVPWKIWKKDLGVEAANTQEIPKKYWFNMV